MGPYTIEELYAFIESGEYDRLLGELERNDGIEPDAACARSLEEGLNMETLASPRGLMQWVMCRAHQIRREDGWQMDAALRRAWEEAEVAGERLRTTLPEDVQRRTPNDITEFNPRDGLPEWFESDGGSDEDFDTLVEYVHGTLARLDARLQDAVGEQGRHEQVASDYLDELDRYDRSLTDIERAVDQQGVPPADVLDELDTLAHEVEQFAQSVTRDLGDDGYRYDGGMGDPLGRPREGGGGGDKRVRVIRDSSSAQGYRFTSPPGVSLTTRDKERAVDRMNAILQETGYAVVDYADGETIIIYTPSRDSALFTPPEADWDSEGDEPWSDGGSDEDRVDFRPDDVVAGWLLEQSGPTRLVYKCPERFTLSAGAEASEVDVRRLGNHWEARLSEFKADGEELPFGGETIERDAADAREAYEAAREWMLNHPCESQMDVEEWQIDRFENEAAELSYDVEGYDQQWTVSCERLVDDWRKAAGLLLAYADLPRVDAVTTGLSYIDWCSGQIRERAGMQGCLPAQNASDAHSYIEQACDALGVDADKTRDLAKQALAELDASNIDYEGHGDRRAERQDFSQFGGAGRGREGGPQSYYGAKFDPENPRRHEAFEDARKTVRVFGPEDYFDHIGDIADALNRGETPYIGRDADMSWRELRSAIENFGIALLVDAAFTEEGDPERIDGRTREEWKREFNAFEQDEHDELVTPEPPADLPETVNGWELVGTARGRVLYEGGESVRMDTHNIYLEIHRVPDKSSGTPSSKFAVWASPWGAERTLRKGPNEDGKKAVTILSGYDTFEATIDAAFDYMEAVPPRDANYLGRNDPRFDLTEEQTMRAAHYALRELLSEFDGEPSRVRHAFENRPQYPGFSQTRADADALTDAVIRGDERLPLYDRRSRNETYWEAHAILGWVAEEYPGIFDDALDHTRDRYGFDESRGNWRDALSPDEPDEDLGRFGATGRDPERKERRSKQQRKTPERGQRSLDDILSGGIGGDVGPAAGRLSDEERERRRKRREERQRRHDERRDRDTQQGTLTGDTTSDADRERAEKEEQSRRRERQRDEEGLDKWAARTGTPDRIIALVGCGSAKFPGRLPAKDKYSSHYYAKKRAYAERNSDEWFILSAKYGLTAPEQPIEDYDLALSDLSQRETNVWAAQVIQALGNIEDAHIVVLAGRDYLDPIEDALADRAMSIETPLAGMGIGEQTSWLKSKVGPVTAPSEPPEPIEEPEQGTFDEPEEPDVEAEDVVDELERGESGDDQ